MTRDKPSFYLYGVGEPRDLLQLGSLVLKDPRTPRTPGYYWTQDVLGDDQLQTHTSSQRISGEFTSKSGFKFGIGVDAAELINVDLSYKYKNDRFVAARSGERIVLRDPQEFLNHHVMNNTTARDVLRLWLSVSTMRKLTTRSPQIWMLTGVYVLTDASLLEVKSGTKIPALEAGVGSVTMTALLGVPVGGSIAVGPRKEVENKLFIQGACVWAGQWRRLDVKYLDPGTQATAGTTSALPSVIRLLPDVVSKSSLRGDHTGFAQVVLENKSKDSNDQDEEEEEEPHFLEEDELDQQDQSDFWNRYDKNMRALREFYQNDDDSGSNDDDGDDG